MTELEKSIFIFEEELAEFDTVAEDIVINLSAEDIQLTETPYTYAELNVEPRITLKAHDEFDDEGRMIRTQLRRMAAEANELLGMIEDEDQFPAWMQSKMTLASQYLDTAYDYYKYSDLSSKKPENIEIDDESTFYVSITPDS